MPSQCIAACLIFAKEKATVLQRFVLKPRGISPSERSFSRRAGNPDIRSLQSEMSAEATDERHLQSYRMSFSHVVRAEAPRRKGLACQPSLFKMGPLYKRQGLTTVQKGPPAPINTCQPPSSFDIVNLVDNRRQLSLRSGTRHAGERARSSYFTLVRPSPSDPVQSNIPRQYRAADAGKAEFGGNRNHPVTSLALWRSRTHNTQLIYCCSRSIFPVFYA